jgi:peptidoglycan-associated lipoprotein
MKKRLWVSLALLLVIPGLLLTVSCAKKQVKTEVAEEAPPEPEPVVEEPEVDTAAAEEAARQAELEEQQRLEAERLAAEEAQRAAEMAKNMFMAEDINFEFDSSVLTPTAQDILQRKSDWLLENADATIIVEGHCDERGTPAYNLALGDRRAESAKDFLVNIGISASRITTISFGEEKPVDSDQNEEAWAKNRRAHFVIE